MWLLQRKRRGLCRLAATCGLRFKGAPFRGVKQSWLGAGLSLLERSAGFWRARRPLPLLSAHQGRRLGLLESENLSVNAASKEERRATRLRWNLWDLGLLDLALPEGFSMI